MSLIYIMARTSSAELAVITARLLQVFQAAELEHWSRLFRDHNIFAGRVWGLLLVWVALAPYVFFRLHS